MAINPDVFMPDLHASLASLGAELLVDTINNLSVRLKEAKPQDSSRVSYGKAYLSTSRTYINYIFAFSSQDYQ